MLERMWRAAVSYRSHARTSTATFWASPGAREESRAPGDAQKYVIELRQAARGTNAMGPSSEPTPPRHTYGWTSTSLGGPQRGERKEKREIMGSQRLSASSRKSVHLSYWHAKSVLAVPLLILAYTRLFALLAPARDQTLPATLPRCGAPTHLSSFLLAHAVLVVSFFTGCLSILMFLTPLAQVTP